MSLKLPALDPRTVAEVRGSTWPEPLNARIGDRLKRQLGEHCNLSQFGVNLVTLRPGAQSALRHWHTHEEEFVYVLSGELVLISDIGEQILHAGDCAGFPANHNDGHHLVNRAQTPAQYLEIGTRHADDQPHYPDDDVQLLKREARGADGQMRKIKVVTHKDGTPY